MAGETRPVLLVTADAAPNRTPSLATDPSEANDPRWLARCAVRDVSGSASPHRAEAVFTLGEKSHVLLNATSDVTWFSRVVPYGRCHACALHRSARNVRVTPRRQPSRAGGGVLAGSLIEREHESANSVVNPHIFPARGSKLRLRTGLDSFGGPHVLYGTITFGFAGLVPFNRGRGPLPTSTTRSLM